MTDKVDDDPMTPIVASTRALDEDWTRWKAGNREAVQSAISHVDF